ncbi:hypothetical protein LCGC14_2057500 [marine sediment metagenome]|uniref:DUF1353 domain-containing protein n=1 Tax=marine sediment metagenome TaxID=412755 RepID=A0A0F9EM13_9ZZZZ
MSRERNSFLTPLVVEVMPSGKTFKVARQFTYLWKRKFIEIHISPGLVTDFASIPRVCRLIIAKLGKHTKASVIHDALYQGEYTTPNSPLRYEFTRAEADLCFRDGNEDLGVVIWKRWAMWAAVRIGGWLAWRKR